MFTFKHVSSATVVGLDGKETTVKLAGEDLSLPTTRQELIDLLLSDADSSKVKVTCGKSADGKEQRIEMDLLLADYATGRKLRSNQDQQKAAKDGGKLEKRGDTAAWISTQPTLIGEFMASVSKARTPTGVKAHNDWLDKVYEENAEAIMANAKSH